MEIKLEIKPVCVAVMKLEDKQWEKRRVGIMIVELFLRIDQGFLILILSSIFTQNATQINSKCSYLRAFLLPTGFEPTSASSSNTA